MQETFFFQQDSESIVSQLYFGVQIIVGTYYKCLAFIFETPLSVHFYRPDKISKVKMAAISSAVVYFYYQ